MDRRLLWFTAALFTALFGILQPIGETLGLFGYPELGYDKLLHMAGGAGLGTTGILLGQCAFGKALSKTHGTLFALAMTATVGIVGWELWEWQWVYPKLALNWSWADTAGDVIWDLVGCTLSVVFFLRRTA